MSLIHNPFNIQRYIYIMLSLTMHDFILLFSFSIMEQPHIQGFQYFAQISNYMQCLQMTKIKKCLLYGSTLQKSFRQDPPCSTLLTNQHETWNASFSISFVFWGLIRLLLSIFFVFLFCHNMILGSCSSCRRGTCQSLC